MTDLTSETQIGYVIFGDEGDIVHGADWDPFGLPILSVLVGDAADTARAWIDANPEARFKLVPVSSADLDEDGPAYGAELVESISLKDQPTLAP